MVRMRNGLHLKVQTKNKIVRRSAQIRRMRRTLGNADVEVGRAVGPLVKAWIFVTALLLLGASKMGSNVS